MTFGKFCFKKNFKQKEEKHQVMTLSMFNLMDSCRFLSEWNSKAISYIDGLKVSKQNKIKPRIS